MKTAWVIHHSEPSPSYNSSELVRAFTEKGVGVSLIDFNKFAIVNDVLTYDEQVLDQPNYVVFANQTLTILGAEAYAQRNKILEKLSTFTNTTFINKPLAHAATSNKIIVYQKLNSAGIAYPKTEFINANPERDVLSLMVGRVGEYPIVVKHPISFEGAGVELCEDADSVVAAIHRLRTNSLVKVGTFVLQEYIRNPDTAMYCVRVIGNQIYTRMFLFTPYDTTAFKAFVSLGRQQLPRETPQAIRDAALATMSTLGLDTARMDVFMTNNEVKIIDVNSVGSLLPTDQTHNIRVADLIVRYAMEKGT
ncbi:RimK Glutathione synthase/Ribosomal protein S6 modification enzyme (glutaminyl transferase) [uncultured Caudovirales phage]|uniref:RimK Glutathione synthase/Ribosomal protein S6 modification enzyme (Glutaminyl transferase) n=1 Tax=uncultured Caudovirales phage TaxID=2100421 RepID=A0A6J5M1A8_9CAUD|nr:RimK Glutathione synthase/Ribosomal protein S6 modification enzyme (glutaminyl transferase) [uncultured Caudovirales phage]